MTRALAFIILAGVLVIIAVVAAREQQAIYALPLIKASEPARNVPWRLYTTCPVNRTNVPVLPRERVV